MKNFKIIAASVGIGVLFAWMESVFLMYSLLQRLTAMGYNGYDAVVLFLSVHCLTYIIVAFIPLKEKGTGLKSAAAVILVVLLPFMLYMSEYIQQADALALALSGLVLSAIGMALLIGGWGVFLSSLIPDDVALVFGLAPIVATFAMRLAAFSGAFLLIIGAPLFAGLLLFLVTEYASDDDIDTVSSSPLPFWRLAVFLFCLYAANGFLLGMMPKLFSSSLPRAEQVSDWIRTLSALGVAVIFRFYPRSELRSFYKGAFPFIAGALFLLIFSPFQTISRLFMEMGLAFLDLYAWLLLIYFASRAGKRRSSVVHGGIAIIILAGAAANLHLILSNGDADILVLAIPGVCLLLLMLALWDGSEVPIQWDGESFKSDAEVNSSSEEKKDAASVNEGKNADKESEALIRMKLMEFNLTRQETEITLLLIQGMKDRNICSLLYISQNTLKYHLRNIYRKTGSANRLELKESLD